MSIDAVLLDIAQEMSLVAESRRARFISYATPQVNFGSGTTKELAIAYLAAHMLTMSARNGASGQVTSEREGSLSRSYGSVTGSSGYDDYAATAYGQAYLRLEKKCVFSPMTRQGTTWPRVE